MLFSSCFQLMASSILGEQCILRMDIFITFITAEIISRSYFRTKHFITGSLKSSERNVNPYVKSLHGVLCPTIFIFYFQLTRRHAKSCSNLVSEEYRPYQSHWGKHCRAIRSICKEEWILLVLFSSKKRRQSEFL